MIDVVTFRLRDGADPDAFRRVDEQLQQEFFYQQPGLIRRTTARSEKGEWISISHWDSPADADAAQAKTHTLNDVAQALGAIDPLSIVARRYDEL